MPRAGAPGQVRVSEAGAFCDVLVRSTAAAEGEELEAHACVLAAASGKLRDSLERAAVAAEGKGSGTKAQRRPLELPVEGSAVAARAAVEFVYLGTTSVPTGAVPDLVRVARRWELAPLEEALAAALAEDLTPEIVAGLFALGEPFGKQLGTSARAYLMANFPAVAQTQQFERWPPGVLEHILRSDDLVVNNEEEVLLLLARWRRLGKARDEAATKLLDSVRWPLLSLQTLDALSESNAPQGSFPAAVAERSSVAREVHHGIADATTFAALVPHPRKAYAGWWAGPGCSIRGASVIAGSGAEGKAGEWNIAPRVVRPHEGTLLFLDTSSQSGRVIQWFLRMHNGRSVAGSGSALAGTGADFEDITDIWSGPDDAYYILDRDAERVVRIQNGDAMVVGGGALRLSRPCAIAVGPDRALYVLDAGGARVVRFFGGRSTIIAGSMTPGVGSGHLNAGLTGRLFVTPSLLVYISDTGNHRVQRWDPGAREGVTVAGGHGCGAGPEQLSHPGGVWALSNGSLYVADTGNHRVMKWRDGGRSGVVVAGGCGAGHGAHQLREPVDVAVDAQGAIYVADHGNKRVVRWVTPAPPGELLATVRG